MGRIAESADAYAEAMKNQPLENANDMETALADLALAEEKLAVAKSVLAQRINEEFPADPAVAEAVAESGRNQKATASGMAGLKALFKRRHQQDYERFEKPRTQEHKLDYRAQEH
jgi:hypothetical protein